MLTHDADALGDAELATRAQRGDQRAFADLLRRHGGVMQRSALRLTRDAHDADDVVQDAALQAWRRLATLDDPAQVRAWMIRITTRAALATITTRRHDHELTEDAASADGPDGGVDRFDLHDGVRAALRSLPEQQAHAWILRQVHGFSYREIAERLGAPESSVRSWLVLARKRVQHAVGERCPAARPQAVTVAMPTGSATASRAQVAPHPVAVAPALAEQTTHVAADRDLGAPSLA